MAYGSFVSIGWMPFLTPSLDYADPIFSLVIAPGFHQHYIKVADLDPARSSLED